MRRILRWAFNYVSALSAALCLATCVLWARSDRHAFEVSNVTVWTATGEQFPVVSKPELRPIGWSEWHAEWLPGRVALRSLYLRVNPPRTIDIWGMPKVGFMLEAYLRMSYTSEQHGKLVAEAEKQILNSGGRVRGDFGYSRTRDNRYVEPGLGTDIERRAIVPDWFIEVLLLPLPFVWVLRRLRGREDVPRAIAPPAALQATQENKSRPDDVLDL